MSGSKSPRRLARESVLQALYMQDVNPAPEALSFTEFIKHFGDLSEKEIDLRFVEGLYRGVLKELPAIDQSIQEKSRGWKIHRMSRIDRTILRLATFELLFSSETPKRVVINEALELAKSFGARESGPFINGILDSILRDL
jgi:N utilization substance protein B